MDETTAKPRTTAAIPEDLWLRAGVRAKQRKEDRTEACLIPALKEYVKQRPGEPRIYLKKT